MLVRDFLKLVNYDGSAFRLYKVGGKFLKISDLNDDVKLDEEMEKYIIKDEMPPAMGELEKYLDCEVMKIKTVADSIVGSNKVYKMYRLTIDDTTENNVGNMSWGKVHTPNMTVRETLKMLFPVDCNGSEVEVDLINLSIFGINPRNDTERLRLINTVNKAIFDPSTATMVPMAHYRLSYVNILDIITGKSEMEDDFLGHKVAFISPIINKAPISNGTAAICLFITQ